MGELLSIENRTWDVSGHSSDDLIHENRLGGADDTPEEISRK
jgi:hypothetical protein